MNYFDKLGKPYRKDPQCLSAQRKVRAYEYLTGLVKGPVRRYRDCFAGIGLGAGVVVDRFSPTTVVLRDLDSECLRSLVEKFPGAEVLRRDFFTDPDAREYDLTALDFNVFSVVQLRRHERLRASIGSAVSRSRYVLLTDSARSKFHLNAARYGVGSWDGYVELLAEEIGTELVGRSDQVEVGYVLVKRKAPGRFPGAAESGTAEPTSRLPGPSAPWR